MHISYSSLTSILALVSFVSAHGAITGATGDAGGKGAAIGIDPTTPRTGTGPNPFQRDTTIFNRGADAVGCGRTRQGGKNNIQTGTQVVIQQNGGTLPQVTPGGALSLTVHQVNGDGAGPYTCSINTDGTAQTWAKIQVTQQVPGKNGRSQAKATDFPLTAAIPAGTTCTGTVAGQNNVCIVKCQNPVGPFGGCVPVQATNTGNTTAAPAVPVAATPAKMKRFAKMFLS